MSLPAGVLLVVGDRDHVVLAGDEGVELGLLGLERVGLVVLIGRGAPVGSDPDGR
jgi:hypothetical protein